MTKFKITQDKNKKWTVQFVGGNGKVMLSSTTQKYSRERDAVKVVLRLIEYFSSFNARASYTIITTNFYDGSMREWTIYSDGNMIRYKKYKYR